MDDGDIFTEQDRMQPVPTFVVNLPEDGDRLQAIVAQLDPAHFEMRGSFGFLGRMLPDGACLRLTNDPMSPRNKGALGVMMSHHLIWEQVARLNAPYALIVEDDVILKQIERFTTVELPQDFDFIFCGDQTAIESPEYAAEGWPDCINAFHVLPLLERRKVSVGAYGYLLSPSGAQRLLALFVEHLFFGHVDVRMMAYCCSLDDLNSLAEAGHVIEELRAIRQLIKDRPKLDGYAMVHPLVIHPGMTSRRKREDALGLTEG